MAHPDSSAIISRTVRTDVPLDPDISEVELRQYALETELRQAQARIRALEGAIKTPLGCWRPTPATVRAVSHGRPCPRRGRPGRWPWPSRRSSPPLARRRRLSMVAPVALYVTSYPAKVSEGNAVAGVMV